jgi:hypothetical protein
MSNWLELYNWLRTITPIDTFNNQVQETQRFSDISIIVMNSKSLGLLHFTYRDCFPLAISGLDLDSTVSDINPAIAGVTFAYSGFTVETLRQNI